MHGATDEGTTAALADKRQVPAVPTLCYYLSSKFRASHRRRGLQTKLNKNVGFYDYIAKYLLQSDYEMQSLLIVLNTL